MKNNKLTLKLEDKDIEILIYNFLDNGKLLKNEKEFIESVASKLDYNEVGFGGWKNEKGFIEHLKYWLFFDTDKNREYPNGAISEEKMGNLIKETIEKCSSILNNEKLHIYVFPTLSKFVIEKMGGVGGRSIWKNVIYIDIFPLENINEQIKFSIAHELAHAVSPFYHENLNLGNRIIFDGIAEHFREYFMGGEKSPWSNTISRSKAKEIFNEIKQRLKDEDYDLYDEVFYGTGKYPLWSGYAIGYYILEDYIKKFDKVDWKKIINTNPEKILTDSGWIN